MKMKAKRKKNHFVVRPWSLGQCPTGEDLRSAWALRRHSAGDFIRLLSVLGELACFVPCELVHKGGFGNIAGRSGGLKAFLEREIPELVVKYKSISRYATLAANLKKAFDIYPPAQLSFMHPSLPVPQINYPFMIRHCRNVYAEHFQALPPTYAAYAAVVRKRLSDRTLPHRWGPAWPRDAWPEVEMKWQKTFARKHALADIAYEYKLYSQTYIQCPQ